jgi:hypothetical protein
MNLNDGDSSASVAYWLTVHNWTLNWLTPAVWIFFKMTPQYRLQREQFLLLPRMFIGPLPSNEYTRTTQKTPLATLILLLRAYILDVA